MNYELFGQKRSLGILGGGEIKTHRADSYRKLSIETIGGFYTLSEDAILEATGLAASFTLSLLKLGIYNISSLSCWATKLYITLLWVYV